MEITKKTQALADDAIQDNVFEIGGGILVTYRHAATNGSPSDGLEVFAFFLDNFIVLDKGIDRNSKRAVITAMLILATCSIATVAVIPWDLELSLKVQNIRIPGDLRRLIQLGEGFAHALGCVTILGTLLWVDVKNRRRLWKAIVFITICGALANAAKYIIPRNRPRLYTDDWPTSSWDTWGSPFTESFFDESLRSFPSGHTATAVAMAIGLSYVYPRGRVPFFLLALLASFQRFVSGAHYASDILAALTLTIFIAFSWIWLASRGRRPRSDAHSSGESA